MPRFVSAVSGGAGALSEDPAGSHRHVAVAKYPKTKTQVHAIDFASATPADYAALGLELDKLDVGVLSRACLPVSRE